MNRRRISERLALWWVSFYTRSAPEPAGGDRRAEVASDVYEQLHHVPHGTSPRWATDRAVLGRTMRGLAADVNWRIQVESAPERVTWHLAHPATALGFLWLILMPLSLLGDAARGRLEALYPLAGWIWAAVVVVSSAAVVFGLVSFSLAALEARPLLRVGVHTWRVRLFCLAAFLWALSGLWRFVGNSMSNVSDFAWAAFGVSLVVYLLLCTTDFLWSRLSLDFRKVSS